MNYTVNQLAKLSGVTIRTLRFYDEIGLLKPAFVAENGYRYYQENELLLLQQILFFRELGFELKQIQSILKRSDFDKLAALQSHKKILEHEIKRLQTLMVTIEKTINHLQGKQMMNENELFFGLHDYSTKIKKIYFDFLKDDEFKRGADEAAKYMDKMPEKEKRKLEQDKEKFWQELTNLFSKGEKSHSKPVQALIATYVDLVKRSGINPTRQVFTYLAESMPKMPAIHKKAAAEHPELASSYAETNKRYDDNPGLAEFMADAMKLYAKTSLS